MTQKHIQRLIELLESKRVVFSTGLTNNEFQMINTTFGIEFPPDLKLFLQLALPISDGFAHWRAAINEKEECRMMQERLNAPLDGILFDIKYSNFWIEDWGEKPEIFEQQKTIATQFYHKYPKLIPIYSHRYIPAKPCISGNPVFSVYQTDIIYYGYDLADYFAKEFQFNLPSWFGKVDEPEKIEFWDRFV
jgi:hypothetical protein